MGDVVPVGHGGGLYRVEHANQGIKNAFYDGERLRIAMDLCPTQQRSERRPIRVVMRYGSLLLVLGLVAAYVLPHTGDIHDSLLLTPRLAWPVLILALVAQMFSYLSSADLLRTTVRQSGHTLSMFRATMIEVATSAIALAPGGVVSYTAAVYRWTRKGGVPPCTAAVAGSVVALFNTASLLFFGVVSAVLLIGRDRLDGGEGITVAIVGALIVAIIAVAVAAVIWPSWLTGVVRAARRLPLVRRIPSLQRADDDIATLGATISNLRRGGWGRPAASAALNLAFDAATLALVFYAAGARVGTVTLLAGYGLPIMLGQASFLPGGLAVTEISMSALYISLGLRPSVVIASVVTYRLVSLWLPALFGLPLIVVLQLRRRKQEVVAHGATRDRLRAACDTSSPAAPVSSARTSSDFCSTSTAMLRK
jgi:uncharacterized membrane protein YbhN (UPF0104 family)